MERTTVHRADVGARLDRGVYQRRPRSFAMLVKTNGKPVFKTSYTVWDDGKTLTAIGSATGTTGKVKVVYDRQ